MTRSEMAKQPLWIDISKHQGQIDWGKIAAVEGYDKVFGCFSRAGWGQYGGDIDQYFDRNWEKSKQYGLYRASYWAYWGFFPLDRQLYLWYKANPTIDLIPRMWDFEVEDNSPQWLADKTWEASEEVLKRDGKRFIIYSRYGILERTLCKYWTPEQLNAHYYMLAQYDTSTLLNPSESNGIVVPTNIEPHRILWKQTSSDYPIYTGSGRVDRDRWIWTDAETMHEQIQEMWGKIESDPEPSPDCCDDLYDLMGKATTEIKANASELEKQDSKLITLRTDVDSIEVRSNDNHVRLGATRAELAELEQKINDLQDNKIPQLERGVGNNATSISNLMTKIDICSKTINDIDDDVKSYMSEIEGRIVDIEKDIKAVKNRITIIGWLRSLFRQS